MASKTTPFLDIHPYWGCLRKVEVHSNISDIYHPISLFEQHVNLFHPQESAEEQFRNYSPEKQSPIQFLSEWTMP